MGFLIEEGFLPNSKSIVSSLFGVILWASRLPSPMQIPDDPIHQNLHLAGLKTLVYSQKEPPQHPNPSHPPFIFHSYMISSSPSPSSSSSSSSPPSPSPSPSPSSTSSSLFRSLTHSSSWSSVIDDFIGTESGVYMSSSEEEILGMDKTETHTHHHGKRKCTMTREYPPPIPLLARTGNLPSHMPWVLTRHYSNGKLVLNLEKVKHHEYFEAHRENGNLILNLVSLDDTLRCCHPLYEKNVELEQLEDLFMEEEKEINGNIEEENVEEYQKSEVDDDDDDYIDIEVVDDIVHEGAMTNVAASLPKSCVENGSERSGDLRKCFTYAGRICNANTHEHAGPYFDQSGSSSLAFSIRPMTTVM